MRHLETRWLWIQDLGMARKVQIKKIEGAKNKAHINTNALTEDGCPLE